MSRMPLKDRKLPNYTRGNEIANMVTHIVGGVLGIVVLVLAVIIAALHHDPWGVVGGAIYGVTMIALYTVSSVYHGLRPGMGKKVMQVIDHCTIFFLIAGSYTPILLTGIRPNHPGVAWLIFGAEWGFAALATVFTAIDHKKYAALAMTGYLGMGWFVVVAIRPTLEALGWDGFWWLLAGGISYTVGAVMYGVGSKKPVMHTVFHVFVVLGSVLHAVAILGYVL